MAKRIGILGGISHESTAKYYALILMNYVMSFLLILVIIHGYFRAQFLYW